MMLDSTHMLASMLMRGNTPPTLLSPPNRSRPTGSHPTDNPPHSARKNRAGEARRRGGRRRGRPPSVDRHRLRRMLSRPAPAPDTPQQQDTVHSTHFHKRPEGSWKNARVKHSPPRRTAEDSPDTSPSQPDTKKCIQVGRETYAVTSQPGTSYTFETGIDTGTFQGQRPQPVTTPVCDDYDSILVIDSSEPRMQPTTTTNTKKTNRTPHGKHAKAQAGAWHRR
jgi:hypothetical protein